MYSKKSRRLKPTLLTPLYRQIGGFPAYDTAGNFADALKSRPLQ
jgi:hypothetical protein